MRESRVFREFPDEPSKAQRRLRHLGAKGPYMLGRLQRS